ncbi:MAG: hypothetical protein AMXMBFR56_72500 [Polyangiaceae bacterium]
MADALAFRLVDGSGAPLTSATPSFVDYRERGGTSRTPPAIGHRGSGVYAFTPTDADELAGVAFLIDAGAGSYPRRLSGVVTLQASPFFAWHLEDAAGALFAGVGTPTLSPYATPGGVALTPPAVVAVAAAYLWAFTPSPSDLSSDAVFGLNSPAGAFPAYLGGSLPRPWGYAPASSGAVKNPAEDVVNFLDTKTAGSLTLAKATNLFVGFMRAQDRTPSPSVYALNTGGPGPLPYLGTGRQAYLRPTVQVMVRGPAGDFQAGEAIARAVLEYLQQQTVPGYVACFARDSQPAWLGEDSDQHGLWSINLELQYTATLG